MKRVFGGLGLAALGLLGLVVGGRFLPVFTIQLGLTAGVFGEHATFQVADHCVTQTFKVTKGSSTDTKCAGTIHVGSASWNLTLDNPHPAPDAAGRLELRCWGRDCEQPSVASALVSLLFDSLATAMVAGGLRGLLQTVRLWCGPRALAITHPRWGQRARRAWEALWLALVVTTAGSVLGFIGLLCLGALP
ncbi:hypothetical protein [Kitasatospora sp. NPDC058190]|uniref:hypothetical protein n=1 Tax=Kitasatospora sp. NPDC058190 TaxID=3346371 RepID=UPI0036DB60DB